jgi:hypothetical protein
MRCTLKPPATRAPASAATSRYADSVRRSGDNVGLYRAVHQALRAQYAKHRPSQLLDIATGQGHGLLGALTDNVGHIDVVEPSAQRLAVVTTDLTRRGVPHRAHTMTAQQFTAGAQAGPWDLVQETFPLMTLSRQDRAALFGWLRPWATRLVLAQFDVPDLGAGLKPRWFCYLVKRYDRASASTTPTGI